MSAATKNGESQRHDPAWPGPSLAPSALRVIRARYLIRDEHGQCTETPAQMFRRVAEAIAAAELRYNADRGVCQTWTRRFYELMTGLRFLPNSPTLMNAGRELGMLSACFVLPVGDSIEEIFDAIKHTALIQKAGGGTGFAFDRLRPTGDYIRTSGGTTSGPISFWRAFCEASNAIQQGAFRRGANMGLMSIDHPDILKFVHAKQDLSQFTNFNISVKITDAWMEALRQDPGAPYIATNPRTGRQYRVPRDIDMATYDVSALIPVEEATRVDGPCYSQREVWELIVRHAWQTGEPGLLFTDRVNEHNPTPQLGRIEATNPCGEQPLLDYESCNLGSINVSRFVKQPGSLHAHVDWDALGEAVDASVRFLDDVIDVNKYPLPQIEAVSRGNRKIGLGVMGFADALFMLGVPYDSDEGVSWGARLMQFINDRAHAQSEVLAAERGSFPNWKGSTWETVHHRPMRNACCTTVAPTGTISMIAGCSAGIEPLYALVFRRDVLREQAAEMPPLIEVNPVFRRTLGQAGLLSDELVEQIAREGSIAQRRDIPPEIRRVFVTAYDIAPHWHVRIQAAFQKHCDASVSKTINLPADATVEDVDRVFQLSYDLRCKGVTVYRNGCRPGQPMCAGGICLESTSA